MRWINITILTSNFTVLKNFEQEILEFFWTWLPGIVLIWLGIPSVELLYEIEIKNNYSINLKILGNQWYWRYDYSNFKDLTFDSFIKPYNDLSKGDFRLLETDNRTVLPFKRNIIALISSNDVIHRLAIPRLNIKNDANPGRLNSFFIYRKLPGTYYGQCSEICGANHSFIPIKLEIVSPLIFKNWRIIFSN